MKIFRPDTLAILYRSFRFARRNTLSIGMLGMFPFGSHGPEGLREEPELWAAVGQAMGDEAILDEGFPKPCGEFKLYGHAWAPSGKPVGEMLVSAKIGGLYKQLLVSGDRHFNIAGMISTPVPFVQMPLTPQRAFGGPDVADNPLGKGAQAVQSADGTEQWPLPNVEYMARRIVSRGDIADAAGFWSLEAAAPARVRHLGQFDDAWMKHTWPHLPDDTHAEYFNSVVPDQRLNGYFNGDEAIELRGLNAQVSTLETRLPGLRARCFVNRRQAGGAEKFSEVQARLETVWLFPDLGCGIVLYRAQSDVADDDASDVLHIMGEWESLGEPARSFEHYAEQFNIMLQPDAPAMPAPELAAPAGASVATSPAAIPAVVAAAPAAVPALAAGPDMELVNNLLTQLEQETAELMRKNGLSEQDLQVFMTQTPEAPALSLDQVHQMAEQVERDARALMEKHNLTDADVAPFMRSTIQGEEPVPTLKEVKGLIQELDQHNDSLMKQHGMTAQDVEKFLSSRPELSDALANFKSVQSDAVPLSAIPDAMPVIETPAMPAPADVAGLAVAAALPLVDGGAGTDRPQLTREQVIERHAAKESLADFDLSGVDLSKLDLAGADFSGSLLEGTVFAGSRLANAKLAQCLMQGADCSEADFSGADLAGASAGGAKFAKARLPGAQLREADFTGADFSEAQLQNAVLDGAIFEQAAMTKLQAAGVSAVQGNFSGADLSGADFAQATLSQAMFNECKLGAANFKAAQCQSAEFYGADASGAQFAAAVLGASRADASSQFGKAVFDGAQLQRAAWEGAQLAGAQFVGARLDDADFSSVQAAGANFRQASAKQAKFGRADLSRADMTGINLFKGSLRKSRVEDAVLHFANLYGADFEGVTVRSAALEGADIERTLFAFRPPLA
jgi:uncharacterized protein YjbI with pentapeptide repeats